MRCHYLMVHVIGKLMHMHPDSQPLPPGSSQFSVCNIEKLVDEAMVLSGSALCMVYTDVLEQELGLVSPNDKLLNFHVTEDGSENTSSLQP